MAPVIGFVKGLAATWAAFAAKHAVLAAVIKFTVTLAASYAIGRVLSPKMRNSLTNGSPLDLTRDPLTPRRIAYGECRLGGAIRFHFETGGNNNQYLYLIIVWNAHPSKAIDELYFNDELVPLDGSGNATGTYAGLVRCTHHLGAWDQAADANFVSELGGTIFTTNDRLRGCTYSALRLKQDQAKFPTGLPVITAKGRWRIPYDPRDESQSPTDPSTWVYTNNAKVCEYDYLRGVPIKIGDGSIARLMGLNADDDEIVLADAIASMNVSDEDVPRATGFSRTCSVTSGVRHIPTGSLVGIVPGVLVSGTGIAAGTLVVSTDDNGPFFTVDRDPTATNASVSLTFGDSEKRYTANGAFDLDALPSTVLDHFLTATAGKLHDIGGDLVMRAGAWTEPDTELDVAALRSGGVTVTAPLSWREKVNHVRGTFSDPEQNYGKNDFPPVTSDALIEADGAELATDLDLTGFVTSPAQAQRVAKVKLLRTRQGIVATKACNLRGALALTGENYRYTDEDFGWDEKAFELLEFTLSLDKDKNGRPGFVVDITGQETAESIFDWDTDEEDTNDPAPNTTLADPRNVAAPTSLGATVVSFRQPDGNLVPMLKLAWTAPVDQAVTSGGLIRYQYKKHADSDWIDAGTVKGDTVFCYIPLLLLGTVYDFQIRSENKYAVPDDVWVQVTSFTMTSDTTPPATRSDLAAAVGTGKLVSLTWSNNTEADFDGQYNIYRGASGGSRTKIATVFSNRFVDPNVTLGTAYDYDVRGVDQSDNEASASNVVTATPTAVLAGSVDSTPPSDPTAATKTGEGTYLAGDGTVMAYLQFSVSTSPTGAVGVNLLYRVSGDSQWLIAGQFTPSGLITGVRIRDLPPSVAYEVATEAFSAFGIFSNVVAATSSPFTTPAKTSCNPPTSIVYVAGNSADFARPQVFTGGGARFYMARANWTPPGDADITGYDWILLTAGTGQSAVTSAWNGLVALGVVNTVNVPEVVLVSGTLAGVSLYVRARNSSSALSTWLEGGGVAAGSYWGFSSGDAAAKDVGTVSGKVAAADDSRITGAAAKANNLSDLASPSTARGNLGLGTIATQNANAAQVTSLTVGAGIYTPAQKVVTKFTGVVTLGGGSPTESIDINLTDLGFSARPDTGQVQFEDTRFICAYQSQDAASTATNARCTLRMADGTNLPSGAARYHADFTDN